MELLLPNKPARIVPLVPSNSVYTQVKENMHSFSNLNYNALVKQTALRAIPITEIEETFNPRLISAEYSLLQ